MKKKFEIFLLKWFVLNSIPTRRLTDSGLSLLAGLDLLTGKVHACIEERHRSMEFTNQVWHG